MSPSKFLTFLCCSMRHSKMLLVAIVIRHYYLCNNVDIVWVGCFFYACPFCLAKHRLYCRRQRPAFENYPVPQQRTQVRAVCDIAGNIFNLCSASLQTFQANRALHGKRLTSYAIALSVNSTRIYEPLDSKLALVHCTPKALLNVAKALRLH